MALCVVAFVVASLFFWRGESTVRLQLGSISFQVEVANSEEERQKGLSDKMYLADDRGMLFVFPHDAQWSIWMRDMRFPLDIVWLDADKKVVHVEQNVQPASYPAYYSPPKNARYVLELASGVAAKTEIKPGAVAQFDVSAATK